MAVVERPAPGRAPLERASLEAVLALLADTVRPLGCEEVPLHAARGRVLAAPVRAPFPLPAFTNAAMDGFAVRAADTASPGARLRLVGDVAAGAAWPPPLAPGTCREIATGAPLPPGADAVLRRERAAVAGDTVEVLAPVAASTDVRLRGEDAPAGAEVLPAGMRIGAGEIALLAALGKESVACRRQPRVAVVTTGDELLARASGERARAGVRDANGPMLAALATVFGVREVEPIGPLPDSPAAVKRALAAACREYDMVVASGGVSVGRHDHVRTALAAVGVEELVRGLALRPGRPARIGVAEGTSAIVFALPGNPAAVFVLFHLLVRPTLARLEGCHERPLFVRGVLARTIDPQPAPVDTFLRVSLARGSGSEPLTAVPCGRLHASHALTSLVGVDALARVPAGSAASAGSELELHLLEHR